MILNSRKRRQLRQQHNKAVKLYHIWREQEGDPEAPIAPGSVAKLDISRLPPPVRRKLPAPYIPLLNVNWYRQFKKTLEAKA
jgi:hypothetical protein